MRGVALVPYHRGFSAGQRFRIERWQEGLEARGIHIETLAFTSEALTDVLYQEGKHAAKAVRLAGACVQHLNRVLHVRRPDFLYIYREAALVGPPVIESLVRRWGVPVVYDIDEPLFVSYVSPKNGRFNVLKFAGKTRTLLRTADQVLAVNEAIAGYARRFNANVRVVPMAVDTSYYRPRASADNEIRIGWTGTFTSQANLGAIAGAIRRVNERQPVRLAVIADDHRAVPDLPFVDFVQWSRASELDALRSCAIGIVPVTPHVWAPWKFYFKLLVYMSLGLPVVAARVGSNVEIIEDGVNGFLADSEDEWEVRLLTLARDPELRRRMGAAARRTVESRFALSDQIDAVEDIFRGAAAGALPTRQQHAVGGVAT